MNQNHNANNQKIAIVTGATGAIGQAIARGIASEPGYEVVLVARDEAKAKRAVQAIIQASGNPDVRCEIADLGLKSEIDALAARWQGPLHVLVNNAATSPRERRETPEGIEVQFAVNVLGYFWMMRAFEEALKRTAREAQGVRVVNVASYYAGDLDLDDLEFKRRRYNNRTAYRQSKQADRMLTAAFAERLGPSGVAVNACHPGDVNSTLSSDLGFGGHESPEQGADTPVWLAVSTAGGQENGRYFDNRQAVRDPFMQDKEAVERLYQICKAYGEQ